MQYPNIKDEKILFLTPTIGSIWLFYQQFLLNQLFPKSQRLLINGNNRWDFRLGKDCVWYDFIGEAVKYTSKVKYFVHIDEDCFLIDRQGIMDCIERMESEGAVLIGPTDNMWPIRGANPNALNSFFMLGRIDALRDIWQNFEVTLLFKDLKLPMPDVPEQEIETEPYYNFFWNYLKQGYKIAHMKAGYSEQFNSTILLNGLGGIFAHHMWYTRHWYRNEKFVSLTHRQRYLAVKRHLDTTYNINIFKLVKSMQLSRFSVILFDLLFTKNIRRLKRRIF